MVFDEFLAIFQTMVTEVGRNYGRSLKMISIFINISLLSADFYEIRRKVCKIVTTTKNVDRIQQKFVLFFVSRQIIDMISEISKNESLQNIENGLNITIMLYYRG